MKTWKFVAAAVAGAALSLAAHGAGAAVLVDVSPGATETPSSLNPNSVKGAFSVVKVTLAQAATLTGFEVLTDPERVGLGPVGVAISFWNAVGDEHPFTRVGGTVDLADRRPPLPEAEWAYAAFARPVALDAGTYWIGMAGVLQDIGWWTVKDPHARTVENPNAYHVRINSDLKRDHAEWLGTHNDKLPFRLHGEFAQAGAVPEPATWAMMLIGFFGLGAALRRRAVLA